ncbi:MAG: hypothetical protein IJ635_05190 [Bacteroidaceae bacterium]|nr:hypothetical protein [Bacteroidaceae bacterium]MBR1520614.1 hypothetical protein [Bacteroidaceae bacterium]
MKKLLLIAIALTVAGAALGKKKPTETLSVSGGKGTGKVYVFGVSQQLTDSVIFVTSICEVDSIDVEKKTKFLPYRSEFSLQLKLYLEGKLHLQKQTACVFFSTERKKLSKRYYKVKKRYLDNPETKLKVIDDQQFTFKHPLDAFATSSGDEANEVK